jgi:ATP-dependent RNA helicase DeaD
MRSPEEVTIRSSTTTAANIRQRYWLVAGMHKLDALTRILEVEAFDAMLVFARTKQATVELAEKLEARGFAAAALNGDIQQSQRERTVAALKSGQIDILVATDVAARGLDVDRISHVVNFDVPYDSESYVHRIGRTGRAGRSGEAILFIAPRERNMLRIIERATRQPIELMSPPTVQDVNKRRVTKFKERLAAALATPGHDEFRPIVEEFVTETGADLIDVAAALAQLAQGDSSLVLKRKSGGASEFESTPPPAESSHGASHGPSHARSHAAGVDLEPRKRRKPGFDEPQATYRLDVGRAHGVLPGHVVGAIAHEADLDGKQINGVDIREEHTFVRLPEDLSPKIIAKLRRIKLRGRPLEITKLAASELPTPPRRRY